KGSRPTGCRIVFSVPPGPGVLGSGRHAVDRSPKLSDQAAWLPRAFRWRDPYRRHSYGDSPAPGIAGLPGLGRPRLSGFPLAFLAGQCGEADCRLRARVLQWRGSPSDTLRAILRQLWRSLDRTRLDYSSSSLLLLVTDSPSLSRLGCLVPDITASN